MTDVSAGALPKHHKATKSEKLVIGASSLGTVFEWYDFYIFGTLASIMGAHFFEAKGINEATGFIFALLAFAAGFLVRPFGALVFGRLGDLVGRKYTFLVTMGLMGLSTFLVGVLPTYAQIGIAAPIILVALRMVQGLALGGEYGGAATYVAEHAPNNKRGAYTAWIQTTATLGLFLALGVIMVTRMNMSEDAFKEWGWRVPFLFSMALLAVSLWIRMQLEESPVFAAMKEEGTHSKAPLAEAFGQWGNLKVVLLALFGVVAGQAVVWYTGQFYALFFLEKMLKVDSNVAYQLIALGLLIGTPGFLFFGWLSDKIGRKPIILAGMALAIVTYFPLFEALTKYANPALYAAQQSAPVTVVADPAQCSSQFDPVGKAKFLKSCDIAKSYLTKAGVSYTNVAAPAGSVAQIKVGEVVIASYEGAGLAPDAAKAAQKSFKDGVGAALKAAGYPPKADSAAINRPIVVAILALLVIYVTMVYGPIAAMLVEMFPTRIRYTSMSLPYHIGNGWAGGLLPAITFMMITNNGNIYFGLWYPIVIAAVTLVIGLLFVPETKNSNIDG
ncbi:MAG: MHS family MFS transporter [Alphaproteobacteria bacterium]|nr:MHS family MFS transporter [Alphaproteobacteria bacterium]